jgi:hypothetical protein
VTASGGSPGQRIVGDDRVAGTMSRTRAREPEPEKLTAIIERIEQTYYIAEHRGHALPVGDEAIVNMVGRIVEIDPRHKDHLGENIEVSLICERNFARDERTPPTDRPFMLPVTLNKRRRVMSAYIPADVLWSLPSIIRSGAITHIEARFSPLHRGSGALISLHFTPAQKRIP